MTDKQFVPSPELNLEMLGGRLKEEREKAGLTRSDIALRTKIALDQIANIEDGRISNMPGVYARGFLRSYCDYLNLNTEEILTAYRRLTSQQEMDSSKPLTSKYVETDLVDESHSRLMPVVRILAVALCLFVIAMYFSPSFRGFVAGYLPDFISERLAPTVQTPPQQVLAQQPQSPQQAPPESFSGRYTLRAKESTWVQVSVDDKPIEHILFAPNQSRSFDATRSITVVAGDGQALNTEWDGQERGLLGKQGPVEVFYAISQPAQTNP
ncbi:MAG: DUF4115 domain-containing protein [Deltaproteobacteria bacterium]|nr:DUF4115 domain-containing protein [Deltaproteobacteria bacterium]